MKKLIACFMLVAVLASQSGCATFGSTTNIQAFAQNAAYLGATIEMQKNPGAKEAFQKAYTALGIAIESGKIDGPTITRIIVELPVAKLQGSNSVIYLQAGAFVFDTITQGKIDLTKAEKLMAFAKGVRAGLGTALQIPEPSIP